MLTMLQKGLLFCSAWIILVPVCISIVYYKRFSPSLKALSIQLFVACATELVSYALQQQKLHNLPLLHLYTILEFSLLYIFYDLFWGNSFPRRIMRSIAISFVVFSIINSLFIQSIYAFNNYARALEALLLIIFSLLCFYKISQAPHTAATSTTPVAWIAAGILIYFSGGFTLFILSNYIIPMGSKINWQIWAVHSFLSILLYSLISIGLWKAGKK